MDRARSAIICSNEGRTSSEVSIGSVSSDLEELNKIVENVLKNNYKSVGDYQNGKTKLFGFFVGQIMKETQGKANPKLVNEILKNKLGKTC